VQPLPGAQCPLIPPPPGRPPTCAAASELAPLLSARASSRQQHSWVASGVSVTPRSRSSACRSAGPRRFAEMACGRETHGSRRHRRHRLKRRPAQGPLLTSGLVPHACRPCESIRYTQRRLDGAERFWVLPRGARKVLPLSEQLEMHHTPQSRAATNHAEAPNLRWRFRTRTCRPRLSVSASAWHAAATAGQLPSRRPAPVLPLLDAPRPPPLPRADAPCSSAA
jgi:hypothetical protein